MKLRSRLFLVIGLLAGCLQGFAQNITNKGTEFWVGYGHHQFMEKPCSGANEPNTQDMVIYLSAEEQPAIVTVTIDSSGNPLLPPNAGGIWQRTYTVPAYTVIATDIIPKGIIDAPTPADGNYDARLITDAPPAGTGGAGLFRKRGIHIVSNIPIVAYAHIYGSASSGATMLLPIDAWGYSYVSINSKQSYSTNCYNWTYVVANHDSTFVEITPSVLTRAQNLTGLQPGVAKMIMLMKGQIYQIIGANDLADANGNNACGTGAATGKELSGTKFKSVAGPSGNCYPFAVFAGSSRTSNPASCGSGGGDNDNQQLFPMHSWGKQYLTAPFSGSSSPSSFASSTYKIAVKDPTTIVKRNGVPLTGLINNNYYTFLSNTADYIEADKPIQVVQFMTGGGCLGAGGLGDPEMVVLSPIEQAIKRTGFYRNTDEAIQVNYLTLVVPTAGLASLKIDNSSIFSYTYPHFYPGYTVVIRRWAPASKAQSIVTCDSAFTAITYGLGNVESYAYNAGTNLNALGAESAIHNILDTTTSIHSFTCINTPFQMSVLMAYKPTNMFWKLSTLASVLAPNSDVNVSSPVPVDSPFVNGIKYYRYTLPGTYFFADTGHFQVPILSTHPSIENCYNTEELKFEVVVKGKPIADFSISHSGCTLDTAHFTGIASTSNNYTVGQWNWEFPGPSTATGQNVWHLFPPGTYNIKLTVISTEGCVGDTTKPITVQNKPTSGFTAPLSVCMGSAITVTDTALNNGINPVTNWYWNFGNGSTINGATPSQIYTYPNYGTYTIKHVASSSNTCVSDTVSKIITVFAKPVTAFSFPTGCIASNGLVQFTNTTAVPDGQSISSWTWNFNDPNANGGNPNNSNLQNPSHNFLSGTYNVNLSASTTNSCVKDTTIAATFNLKPALAYPPLNNICENASPISVATATVTNGVTGTGVYQGPGTSSNGTFTPSIAGPGTHTIWYVFTSTANCKDSISQTITVYASPKPNFTFPAGCLNANGFIQFTNTTTIADAQTLSFTWSFADPNANGSNPNTSTLQNPSHYFLSGTYNVNLSVTSSNGCVKDTTKPSTFNLKPALAYPVLAAVCENISSISVATATVTNSVSGTGVYSGAGTNGAGVFTPSAAGSGVHIIKYVFTSTAGCVDSITQTIKVHPKPGALFTVNATICQNQSATITDQSTIVSGNIITWNWDFGDATSASYNNGNPFSKSYATFNNYIIKLIAVSDSGCLSDPSTKTVAVHAIPVANFNLPTGVCMPGGTAGFTNTSAAGDNSSLNYQWDFGDGSPVNTNANPLHVYSSINTYNVRLTTTSVFGCVDDTVKLFNDFYDKPIASFLVTPDTLCQGTDNIFTDKSSAPNSSVRSWSWNFDDGNTSASQNPTKRFANPGNYDVQLTVTNTVGCISDPFIKTVVVYLQPVIDAGPSFIVPQGTVIKFNPKVNDSTSVSFLWSPPFGLSNAAALRPSLTAVQDQTYMLTATGVGNCTATDFITVKILKPVTIPNAFSPNGDGINDTWIIQNLEDYPGATVDVFNRYGQQVFHSSGYSTPWDGKTKGNPLPLATYYYVIELKNGFKPLTGSLTIVR